MNLILLRMLLTDVPESRQMEIAVLTIVTFYSTIRLLTKLALSCKDPVNGAGHQFPQHLRLRASLQHTTRILMSFLTPQTRLKNAKRIYGVFLLILFCEM